MARPTRSPALDPEELGISPEVAWYLDSRGIVAPTCPPKVATPEPRMVEGARFDAERVDRVLDAFGRLRHTQGRWAGQPLRPDPWQVAYILAPVFGWVVKEDGRWVRIIRQVYVDVPRKNGKTTIAGGIAIILTAADGESGAQVYAVAASKQQAGYCFNPVKSLAESAPDLKSHIKTYAEKIVHPATGSYFGVVASIGDLLHGANVHGAVIDELHVHKTADVVEAVETGTGARDQPLVLIITTPDDGRTATIYDRKRRYIEKLARGTISDPSVYGVVWGADAEDDPFAESTWAKANPGYGISPTRKFMQDEATKAQNSPADLAKFQRLHLGLRTKQETKYLTLDAWDRNAGMVVESDLVGRPAFGGLDLASTSDLCAFCLLFPDEDGYDALWRLWLPEDASAGFSDRTAGESDVWVRQGLLTLTPGNVADYDFIREQINRDREVFRVGQIAYDPWNASQLVNDLMADGAEMVPVRQGFPSLSAPTKELQRLLLEGTPERPMLRHGGNGAMRWMVDNFAVAMDPAGNVKPDKAKAADKIDGVAALIDALSRAMLADPPKKKYRVAGF